MIKKIYLLSVFLFLGCARVQTLNMEPHLYSQRPQKILWIQIAGFTEEHIPLLKFNTADTNNATSFEGSHCLGKMWNFNLYELRPNARNSFMSQMTGSKNIKSTCEDYDRPAVWTVLSGLNYSASILENAADATQTLEAALACEANKMIDLKTMRFWKMGSNAPTTGNTKSFHYQDPPAQQQESLKPGLYFDRSCQKGICFSSLSNNFKSLWSLMNKESPTNIFIVRDFNFMNALKKKDISYAKESLQEIDRILSWVKKESNNQALIIVSGAESIHLDFPSQGKEWAEFERSGKNVSFNKSTLMSPVLAYGAMAENFCGLYDESEMFKRIIHRPERKRFNWDYINPF